MIEEGKRKKLALYDTNGQGGVDDLKTTVYGGNTVYWSLDNLSGIKEVKSVYAKDESKLEFVIKPKEQRPDKEIKFNPKRKTFSKGFKWAIPAGVKGTVKYGIKFIDYTGEEIDIDPELDIPPPPD